MSLPFTRCLPYCIAKRPGHKALAVMDRDYQVLCTVEKGLGPKTLEQVSEGHESHPHGEFWYLRPGGDDLTAEEWAGYTARLRVLRSIWVDNQRA